MTYAARHGSEGTTPVDGPAQDLIDAALSTGAMRPPR